MNNKPKKDKSFIKKPIFIGGTKAMQAFVKSELKYPKDAIENRIEGTVYLTYDIDYKGVVSNVKILSSLGYGCDEEAIRIAKLFKFEIPDIPYRQRVKFNKKLQIHFKLPSHTEEKNVKSQNNVPTLPSQTITYTYTTKSSNVSTEEDFKVKKQSRNYNYTLKV